MDIRVGMRFNCSDKLVRTIIDMDVITKKIRYRRSGPSGRYGQMTFLKSIARIEQHIRFRTWVLQYPTHVMLPKGA